MRRIGIGVVLVAAAAALGACTTIDRAVGGFEADPGGWTKVSETTAAAPASGETEYLGASADGLLIVRVDGTTQIWRTGR